MRSLARALAVLLMLCGLAPSQAAGPIFPVPSPDTSGLAPRLVPVATGSHFPFQPSSNVLAAGTQLGNRTMHWFPKGATNIRLSYTSVWAGAIETPTATGFPLKLSVSVSPPPWDPTKSYNLGDIVVGYATQYTAAGAYGPSPFYRAAVANTNSRPSSSNSNWTLLTNYPNPRYPVTVDGAPDASFGTQTIQAGSITAGTGGASSTTLTVASANVTGGLQVGDIVAATSVASLGTGTGGAGTYTLATAQTLATGTVLPVTRTLAKAIVSTDPLPVIVPPGGWLEVEAWVPASGSQVFAIEPQSQNLALGPMYASGSAVQDATLATLSGSGMSQGSFGSSHIRPALIVGNPMIATKTVAIVGDSLSQGIDGGNTVNSCGLVSGGTAYKVGDALTPSVNGSTAGAMAAGSVPRCIVDRVDSNGVILSIHTIDGGAFANTATQTGQTLPSGTQTLAGGSGTGATATLTFSANAYDAGDTLGGQGYIERALDIAGVPSCSLSASGDRVNLWTGTRSMTRLKEAALCGADIADEALGRNDLTSGDSAATIQANLVTLASMLRGVGVRKVFVSTVTPEITSTTANGLSTLTDQNVTSNDAARQTLNASLRANWKSLGFDGLIDVAAAVENGGGTSPTGKFDPIGGQPCAADGKHPGPACIQKMIPAVSAAIPAMISLGRDLPRAANDNDADERRAA